jgi:hypothetical protein
MQNERAYAQTSHANSLIGLSGRDHERVICGCLTIKILACLGIRQVAGILARVNGRRKVEVDAFNRGDRDWTA